MAQYMKSLLLRWFQLRSSNADAWMQSRFSLCVLSARDVALERLAASHVDERQSLEGRIAARMMKYLQHAPERMVYGVQNRRGSLDSIGASALASAAQRAA
jgi:Fic family protein